MPTWKPISYSFLFSCHELEHLHCITQNTPGTQHSHHSPEQSIHNDTQQKLQNPSSAHGARWEILHTPPPPPSLQEAGDIRLHVSLQLFVVKMPPLKTAQVKGVHSEDVPEGRNLCDSSFKDRGCDTHMRNTLGHSRFYSHFLLMFHVNYLFFGVRTNFLVTNISLL